MRLERGAGERAASGAKARANAFDAEARPGEARQEIGRKVDVDELDVRMQRAVAEQHVERLRDVVAGGGGREADDCRVLAVRAGVDRGDAAHHLLANVGVGDRGVRQLDALLERERVRDLCSRSRGARIR